MLCFDTDILSLIALPRPPTGLPQRIAEVPIEEQSTTAITVGEMVYGLARRGDPRLDERIGAILAAVWTVHPFDEEAAEVYGRLRARLEREGKRLAEPDLRIASIALARDLTLVTGKERHFARVPDLRVENWLRD